MDFASRKELDRLKEERNSSAEMLEAEKFSFQHMLEGEMGKKMMEELNNPPKPSIIVGIKNRYRRWKTIRDNKRAEKKIKKGGF